MVLGLGLVLLLLALPASASAAPTVTLKAKFLPIPGFAHTGDILGAGAALMTELKIESAEYGGHPPPIEAVAVQFPSGTTIDTSGFATCPSSDLVEEHEPAKCPKPSNAGPPGEADGYVVFEGEEVPEVVKVESFFVPGTGIDFFIYGDRPALIEKVSSGHFTSLGSAGGFGPRFLAEVPLIETVTAANDASLESIVTQIGKAYKKGAKTVYFFTVPNQCPNGGLVLGADITFAGLGGLGKKTVPAEYLMPCPAGQAAEAPVPQTVLPGTGGVVTAPSNKVCVSRRDFPIHVQQIPGLTYREVRVEVNGHPVRVVRKVRFGATVDLRGLPKGRYTVKITVITTTGRRITGTRAYHTCARKPLPFKPPKL